MALEAESRTYQKLNETNSLSEAVKTGEAWLIGVNAALLIINIVIPCIYYGQLKQMRIATGLTHDAVKVASDTLAETQASNARQAFLTDQARKSSETTSSKSLQATIENFHLDQRAWVGAKTTARAAEEALVGWWL
jgi:hypothetical protein